LESKKNIPEKKTDNLQPFLTRLCKDTIAYTPATLVPAILSVLSISIFTRVFSPVSYGQYTLVIVTTTILTSLFSTWIEQSTLRLRPSFVKQKQEKEFNKNLFILLITITAVLMTVAISLYPPLKSILGSYKRFYFVGVGIVTASLWYQNLGSILKADLRSIYFTKFSITQSILRFSIALVYIYFISKDIIGLLWGILLSLLLLIIPMANRVRSYSNVKKHKGNKILLGPFVRRFAAYGFPLIGWFVGSQLLNISDRYILQFFQGSKEVGIYAPNYNLVSYAIGLLTTPLLTAAHSIIMKATNYINKNEIQDLITSFSRYFLLIAFPLITFIVLFSQDLAAVFLGAEFREGHRIIPIITLGFLSWHFSMYGHKGLEIHQRTQTMLHYVIICTVVNIGLNLYFIPQYGYMGAATTTLLSFLLYPIMVFFGTKKSIPWRIPWKSALKLFLVSIIYVLSIHILKSLLNFNIPLLKLITGGILLVLEYTILLLLIKEIQPNELRLIWQTFSNIFKKTMK
jgi:O-antigen/teichoic acid export membrane protein